MEFSTKDLTFEFQELDPSARLRELILHIANSSIDDPRFSKVKLAKLLYLADTESFRRFGKPISGSKYIKWPFGPVPDDYNNVLAHMEQEHAIGIRKVPYYSQEQHRVFALIEPELNKFFSANDIRLVDDIIHQYWNMNATEISDYSHNLLGWKVAEINEPIPYESSLLSDEPLSADEIAELQELAKIYGDARG
ncbi:MAG: SocA family protein [Anaerolineae bacterium]|nr:SocA family protein [Anaerolineae bacterium]